ncbi:cysteine desulfurase family protein [Metabacillus sediminilitoris]|uniref:Cysteine desulfurase n=1 Tax=Metabacillus sediminilitoris TaxID=2567941 RepID=A0A4S4C2Q0_9BACI|nr:cysteine desulfurase family protein [Metabacillus sediminilitoris]QGQ47530.1 aminotransferase class V-fold PLP-dependent enzyme [Metabacillus sediminilitoris]THF81964.1 cysteine desulfurase [Metabacillus sediminilitoris]
MLYLDNSATTKPYPEVLSTYLKVTEDYFANPSSLHKLGSEAEMLLNQSRKQVATLLGVQQGEIIFTSGGTEGNNLAIKGAALANKHKGRHIITSSIEHPSVLESFKQLEEFHGFNVTYLPVNGEGIVSLEHLEKAIRDDTILISIMHVNNEVGTIQPIAEIGQMLKNNQNILFHVDNVQGITKVPLDLKNANIDLCTISGHKFHGLNGSGVLFKRSGVDLLPLFSGGSQELQMRSGTESLAGNVALAKALRMATEKAAKRGQHLENLHKQLRVKLMNIEGVVINTPLKNAAPHIINFSVPAVKAEVLIHFLGEHDIYVSTTSACSSRSKTNSQTLLAMNKPQDIAKSAIRVSLSYESNEEMILTFIDTLSKGIEKLMKVMR